MVQQAVLLIHGIGEQKPMDTLRRFVDAVWVKNTDIQNEFAVRNAGTLVWSKPDTVSDRILRALAAHPEAAFDIDEVTFIIGAPRDQVARALGHLRKARQIDRVGLGIYRAHRS